MVRYDPIRVFQSVPKAVDALLDGLWGEVCTPREELIREAKGLTDEAATLLGEMLPQELGDFVGDDDVAYVSAALAVARCEGWEAVLETALHQVESAAAVRYQNALLRGDVI